MDFRLSPRPQAADEHYTSLITCRECDRVLSIGEYIEDFCPSCEADRRRLMDREMFCRQAPGGAA